MNTIDISLFIFTYKKRVNIMYIVVLLAFFNNLLYFRNSKSAYNFHIKKYVINYIACY